MNVAALGNVVAQLHVHHIARYEDDPAWPGPVWGHSPAVPYDEKALAERVEEVSGLFASHFLSESEITAETEARDVVYW
jgi:diadenosine tetraphosphate (Ap4A) HIT family hydrolase